MLEHLRFKKHIRMYENETNIAGSRAPGEHSSTNRRTTPRSVHLHVESAPTFPYDKFGTLPLIIISSIRVNFNLKCIKKQKLIFFSFIFLISMWGSALSLTLSLLQGKLHYVHIYIFNYGKSGWLWICICILSTQDQEEFTLSLR